MTYHRAFLAEFVLPFLRVHFHSVNGHGFSVFDANFDWLSDRRMPEAPHAQTQKFSIKKFNDKPHRFGTRAPRNQHKQPVTVFF